MPRWMTMTTRVLALTALLCALPGPAQAQDAGRLDVRYLPGYQRFWIDRLEIFDAGLRERAEALRLELLPAGGGETPLLTRDFRLAGGELRNVGIDDVAFDAAFVARGRVLGAGGEELLVLPGRLRMEIFNADTESGRDRRDFETFGRGNEPFSEDLAQWMRPPAGVPEPFEPVRCVENMVGAWGRDYELSALGLPERITVRQPEPTLQGEWEQVLAGQIELTVVRGRRHVAIVPEAAEIAPSGAGLAAAWSARGSARGVAVRLAAQAEYDGVITYELTYGPAGEPVPIDGLYLEVPLREEHATLMHVLSDSPRLEYSGAVPEREGIVWDSAERINRKIYGTFRCMAWLGTEDRGLCWFGDSDRGYLLDDYRPALAVRREPDRVVLEVRVVNHPVTLGEERTISFGLLATPVKPLPSDWRRWIFPNWRGIGGFPHLFQQVEIAQSHPPCTLGSFGILPQDWEETQAKFAELRERVHPEAIYMEYWCMDRITLGHPQMRWWAGEWARPAHDCSDTYSPHYEGENRLYSIVDRSTPSLLAFRLWALDTKLKRLGPFSFYEDNAQQRVQFDLAKGFGYVREDGNRQAEFDTLALRDYFRRVAQVFDANGLRNLTAVHKSYSMLIPAYTHVTLAIDGEQEGQNDTSRDYIDVWRDKLAYFRSHILGRQYGVVPCFLSEIRINADEDPDGKFTRALMTLLLPHDVLVWPCWQRNMAPVIAWWHVKDEFGFGRVPMSLHPYWASERHRMVTPAEADVYATVWQAPDAALMVAGNFGEARSVRFDLELERLGLSPEGGVVVRDAESGEEIAHESPDSFELALPRHDYRLVVIRSAERDVVARVDFDDGLALTAGGERIEPREAPATELVDGLRGRGYAGPALTWALPEEALPAGSISLWLRPVDWALGTRTPPGTPAEAMAGAEPWPAGDAPQRDFLALRVPSDEGAQNGISFSLHSVGGSGLAWAMHADAIDGRRHVAAYVPADRMQDWNPASWHHVVVAWQEWPLHNGLRVYVDGRDWDGAWAHVLEGVSRRPPELTLLGPDEQPRTVIDEVTIYNRLLGPDEVQSLYRRGRPAAPDG